MTLLDRFWAWYEANYTLAVGLAAFLFTLQLVHLYWLTTDVVAFRLFGTSYFPDSDLLRTVIVLVDYTEIPAIVTTSLVYLRGLRQSFNKRDILLLIALNLQFVHIFWITDEFVVNRLVEGAGSNFPTWAAWAAIAIDYLELPVIYETLRRFLHALGGGNAREAFEQLR